MNNIRTITTIALVNFAVVAGIVIGWQMAAKSNQTSIVPTPATFATSTAVSGAASHERPAPQPAPAPAPKPDNRCIVTIQGKRYDVTQLRLTHSGGDVFVCGTDMTTTFFSQHDQQLLDTTMRQYLVQ